MRRPALALAALLLAGCGASDASSKPSLIPLESYTPPPPEPTVVVTYEVEGVATDATVTMQTPNGTSQEGIPDLDTEVTRGQRWRFPDFAPGDFLYISIQGGDENTYVTCRIKVGREVIAENSSDAPYGIASCDGSNP